MPTGTSVGGGEERRAQHDVADVAAGQPELARPAGRGRLRVARHARPGRQTSQIRSPLGVVGERELDDERQPAGEGVVEVAGAGWWPGSRARRTAPSAAAGRRSRCWRSGRGRRGPRSACRTARRPRRRAGSRSRPSAAAKMRSRFFSVSPMYLLDDRRTGRSCTGRGRARGRSPRRPSSCRCRAGRRTAR